MSNVTDGDFEVGYVFLYKGEKYTIDVVIFAS